MSSQALADERIAGAAMHPIETRVDTLDWPRILDDLQASGFATTGPLLDPAQCDRLVALYGEDAGFRSRIVMARHGFGEGEYRYFDYPLPDLVAALRQAAYPRLVPVANRWAEALRLATGASRG